MLKRLAPSLPIHTRTHKAWLVLRCLRATRRLKSPWLGVPATLIVVAYIMLAREFGIIPFVPFLLLFAAVIFSGVIGGFRPAAASAGVASVFIIFSALEGFGPKSLTGGIVQVALGVFFIGSGTLVGRYRDHNRALVTALSGLREGLEQQVNERTQQLKQTIEQLEEEAVANRRLLEQVQRGEEQLRKLSNQLVDAQESERRRITRELHDEVGQRLTGLDLTLRLHQESLASSTNQSIAEAREIVLDLHKRISELSLDLRPAVLDDLGLLPAVLRLIERYSIQTGIEVAFQHNGLSKRFSPDVETAVFRTVQEGLTNIARHASVSIARVEITADKYSIRLEIEDKGIEFDSKRQSEHSSGTGLTGMRERAISLGGTFGVESVPGQGSIISATVPTDKCN